MKKNLIYWISTGLFSIFMLFSAYGYFTDPTFKDAFAYLGYPDYFRIELGVAKVLGIIALLPPFIPRIFKGLAYAGFTINLIGAGIAHLAIGEGISSLTLIFVAAILLGVSYFTQPAKSV